MYCKNSYFGVNSIKNGKQRLFGSKSCCHADHRDFALGIQFSCNQIFKPRCLTHLCVDITIHHCFHLWAILLLQAGEKGIPHGCHALSWSHGGSSIRGRVRLYLLGPALYRCRSRCALSLSEPLCRSRWGPFLS